MAAPSASSDDLGSGVTAEGSRRSKIIAGASVSARAWQLLGLPGDQIELVALRVDERGLADRPTPGGSAAGRSLISVSGLAPGPVSRSTSSSWWSVTRTGSTD